MLLLLLLLLNNFVYLPQIEVGNLYFCKTYFVLYLLLFEMLF